MAGNLQVYVGGQCNHTFNLAPFSPDLSHSAIHFRGAITEDLCRGPGCVIQERSAVITSSSAPPSASASATGNTGNLTSEYSSRCATAGGTFNLKGEYTSDGAEYRIGYCGVTAPADIIRVGAAMQGLNRTSVWCSSRSVTGDSARRGKLTIGLLVVALGGAVLGTI